MSRFSLAALCGGLLLLILLMTAPARLAGYWLPEQQLSLQGFSGSLWQGQADRAAVAVSGGWLQLGEIEWHLSPWSLLWLSPQVELKAQWGQQLIDASISVSPTGRIELEQTSVTFSANLVQQWLPVQLGGSINLLVPNMELEQGLPVSGEGRLVWQRASWTGNSGSQLLGDYVVEFKVEADQQFSGAISTLAGPVQAAGTASLQGRSYTVDVQLKSEQGFNKEISNALQLMAAPVENGYHVKFSSEF
jgi:hypothetical protein